MENKKRGRPPGAKKEIVLNSAVTTEPKKRGRKAKFQTEADISIEVPLEGEIEGTAIEKLKMYAEQILVLDRGINVEPYRFDLRTKKQTMIERMCFLIEEL
jgi:hypothetical protein